MAGGVGDVGLGDVMEPGGLDLPASGETVGVGKPAAAEVFAAVGAETRLSPNGFGADGLGEIDDAGEFRERTVGVDQIGVSGRMVDAFLGELLVAPCVQKKIIRVGTALDVDGETGADQGFRDVAGGPVDEKDGVGVLEDFDGAHDGRQ